MSLKLFLFAVGTFAQTEIGSRVEPPDYVVTCECSLNSAVNQFTGRVDINKTAGCPYPRKEELEKLYPDPIKRAFKAYTSFYNKTEDKYYCKVRAGHCIDIAHWQPRDEDLNEEGYPCHERKCAKKLYTMKGCVEFNQTNPVRDSTTKFRPSSCSGQYGEDEKRKNGSFTLKITGIAHVPLISGCNPICTGKDFIEKNEDLKKFACKTGCSFSRVYCCADDKCNTDHAKNYTPYEGYLYDEWQDQLEESIRTKRSLKFNSTLSDSSSVKLKSYLYAFAILCTLL